MSCKGGNMVSIGRVLPSNAFKYNLFQYVLDGKAKKVLHLFSESGADLNVDICNSRGQTALFVSCITGHYKCVVTLLQLGSNANKRSDDGSTPTHAAAFSCNPMLLQVVVDHGGDLRLHDYRDLVPRDWAVEAGPKRNKKVIELIDRLHDDAISTILSSKNLLTYKYNRSSSASLSRIMGSNETLPIAAAKPVRQPKVFKHGFGDFVSIPMLSSGTGPNGKLTEIGYLALTPIINKDHLFHAATEPSITYQAPPWFVLTNGFFGVQAVTIKKINKVKKKVSRQFVNTHDLLIAELNTNRLLSHPNILLLMGVCMESWNEKCESDAPVVNNPLVPHCFVYERVSLGSLYHLLHVKHQRLPLRDSTLLLLQVADALSYLHQRGFIHCCISAYSIQIINSYTAKLSDFYYAIYSESSCENRQQIYPAFNRWLAPEILAEKQPSIESDIYSFCVVACEAMSGALPWQGYDPDSIRHHVVAKGHVQTIPVEVPEYFRPLLSQGLCLSRRKRAVKLNQITFSLQYIYKFGNISACEGNEESRNFSPGLSPMKCDKTFGDMGLDVPDAIPFDTPVGRKPQRLVETDGKSQSTDTPNTNRSFSVGDSRMCKMMPQPSMHSTRCLSRDGPNSATIKAVNAPAVGNRQSSVRVSIHSGDFYPKINNSDDDIGCIHPDLCSTDSANTSVAGSSIFYPSRNYGSSRLDGADCTPIKTQSEDVPSTPVDSPAKKEIDEMLLTTERVASATNKTASNAAAEASCLSPYPNLNDCKSSLGEYVLSGMSDNEDNTVPKCVEAEQSPLSVTSSYLSNVFPKSSEKSRSTEERRSLDVKNPVTNDQTRLSSGSVANEINFNSHGRDSPLHNSVQKVRHSLVELSMMLQPQLGPIGSNRLPEVVQPELVHNSVKDVNTFDQHDCSLSAACSLEKQSETEEFFQKILSDENFKFPHTAATFFDEVISATGMQELQSAPLIQDSERSSQNKSHAMSSSSPESSEALSEKSSIVYTNVAEWKQAVKNATRRQSVKMATKPEKKEADYSSGTEKRNYPNLASENAKSDTGWSSADSRKSDNIKVLFSTFKQPHKSKTDLMVKDSEATELSVKKQNSPAIAYFPECSTDNCSQFISSQTTSIDGKPMPHPSAFYPYEDVLPVSTEEESPKITSSNNPHQRDSFSNNNSQKRFSISSADLEEIFSGFADRPSFHEAETASKENRQIEPVLSNQNLSSFHGLDVPDGPQVLSKEPVQAAEPPSCPPRKAASRKKLMLSKACQTEGKKTSRTTQIDDRKVNSKKDRVAVLPRSPPVVNDFLQKTGDWTSILLQTKRKTETSCDIATRKVDTEPSATNNKESDPNVEYDSESLEVNCEPVETGISCHVIDTKTSCAVHDADVNSFVSYSSPQGTSCPKNLKPAIQPASHIRPNDATYCVPQHGQVDKPSASSTKTSEQNLKPRPDLKYEAAFSNQATIQDSVEINKIPQLTPSKMSFQNKLSLFESKLNTDSKPISPERASSVDQAVLQKMSGIPYPKPIYHTSSLKQVCDTKHCVQANITNTSQNSCEFHQAENTANSSQVGDGSRAYVTATEEEDELLHSSPDPKLSSFNQENDFETSTPVLNRTNTVCPNPAGGTQNCSMTHDKMSEISSSSIPLQAAATPLLVEKECELRRFSAVKLKNYLVKKSSLPRVCSLPDIREITDLADLHPDFIQTSNTMKDHFKTRVEILCPDTHFSHSSSLISEDSSSSAESSSAARNTQLEDGIDSLANSVTEDVLVSLMTSNEEDELRRHKEDDDHVCEDSVYVDADTQGKDAGDHAVLQMTFDAAKRNMDKENRPTSEEYETSILLASHLSEDQLPESDKETVSDSIFD